MTEISIFFFPPAPDVNINSVKIRYHTTNSELFLQLIHAEGVVMPTSTDEFPK